MMDGAWLAVWRTFLGGGLMYLGVIGTMKLVMMRRLDRTVRAQTKVLRTQSEQIAATLALIARLPDPPNSGMRQAVKKARIISIAEQAQRDLDNEHWPYDRDDEAVEYRH